MQVQINFLPVGHTHEDVDQLFSRIGDEIRATGCESLPGKCTLEHSTYFGGHAMHTDLLDLISRSSTPNPVTTLVSCVWEVKELLQPYLEPLEGHSRYAVFRFTLNSEGKSELHYKKRSDKPWLPEDAGIRLLSVRNCILYVVLKVIGVNCFFRGHLILLTGQAWRMSICQKWIYLGC
jgi:hypothetical protein